MTETEWPDVIDAADLMRQADAEWQAAQPTIAAFASQGWKPAPGAWPRLPIVWLHEDGSWGLSKRPGEDPGAYWWAADRVDSVNKLLKWIRHLTGKVWFTKAHVRQMMELYEHLHPGTIAYGA